MEKKMEKTRSLLGDLAALHAKAMAAEKRILEQAERRLTVVQAEIEQIRTGIEIASEKEQDWYLELIRERGILKKMLLPVQQ